jgi:CheY-like chemotaxis protein
VRVRCERISDDRLRVVVQDSGPGIADAKLSRLFTPFDRLDAEQTGVEGTGLGLALSRRLAEAMGGSIGVESTVGVGSTFWVELPSAENPMLRLERTTPAGLAFNQSAQPARPTRRILYVEDNLSNMTLVQRILGRDHDIELIPAMQGGLAVELAQLHRPDLILLDLHLPDIPGEQVLKQLQGAADCGEIPVVVLSADATPGQIERLMALGARAYVTKPLAVQPFIEIINQVMGRERAA